MKLPFSLAFAAGLAGPLGAAALSAATPASARPNVIFILSDDQAAWAIHGAGAPELKTPNLDRLIAEGTFFTNSFTASPICSPSRMSYFTGRMPSTHGLQFHLAEKGTTVRRYLDGQPTFSQALTDAGYTVGMSGKWHMGGDLEPQQGFSFWRVIHGVLYKDPNVVIDGAWRKTPGFKTDLECDYALQFIEENKGHPFALYWAANAPHRDYDYQPPDDRAPYHGSSFPSFPDEPMHPWQNPNPQLVGDHGNEESKTSYAALVTGLDRNIGRLLQRLKDLGLLDKTLIVFAADNGYNTGHHGVWGKGSGTVPFNLYEESVRVPLLWWYPGHIPAGVRLSQLVANYDFFPTLMDYLGIGILPDPKRVGRSYAPFLRGESPPWRDRIYFEYAYMRGVRTADTKLIERTEDWPSELYDLVNDPHERRNLTDDPKYATRRNELDQDLRAFFTGIGAPPLANWATTTTQRHPPYSTERLPWYPLKPKANPSPADAK